MEYLKNVAFIPVRGGSKSIPLKNIKIINGRPLVYWVLDAAENSKFIQKVFVSTDSAVIKDTVLKYRGNKITVINRSPETAKDDSTTESALLEFAEKIMFENVALIQATSPLLTADDLDKGFLVLEEGKYDSIISVVRQKRFLWTLDNNGYAIPQNYDPLRRPRRQEFEGFFVENGAFYITSRKQLLKSQCRISGRIGMVEMDESSYYELDEPDDWIIVENLLKIKKGNRFFDLSKIRLFAFDCDGVLTDGGMYYSEKGDELKKFNTRDGMAIRLLKEVGIKTALISGENMELIRKRALKLQIDEVHLGVQDKLSVIIELAKKYDITLEEIAYLGDDLNDLDVIKSVGFGCSVNDGMEVVKSIARYVTRASGGNGAVREIAELLINSKRSGGKVT